YGVSDLEALEVDTHKFESRYTHKLVAPYPERADLYRERSPINHTNLLSAPVIFFQGLEDKIVPPNQAEMMVNALRAKGLPVAYITFEGEQHGFRQSANIKRALDGELYFYSRVFGFELADAVEPVEIENLNQYRERERAGSVDRARSLPLAVLIQRLPRHQHSLPAAEDSSDASGHQRRQRRRQQRAQAQTGQVVAARWGERRRAPNEDRHRSDVRKTAQRIAQYHHTTRVRQLSGRHHMRQILVRDHLGQDYSLAQQPRRPGDVGSRDSEQRRQRVEEPTQDFDQRQRLRHP